MFIQLAKVIKHLLTEYCKSKTKQKDNELEDKNKHFSSVRNRPTWFQKL